MSLRVAVLTLTRDRLDYTRHCFQTLQQNAGCLYDHYVLDQASTDGTPAWLSEQFSAHLIHEFALSSENIGISRAMNVLLDNLEPEKYDVVVKFDNDCELVSEDALRDIALLVREYGLILSPEIHGLRNPPPTIGRPLSLGGMIVDEKAQIGGIFLAAPASVYTDLGYRYNENNPIWGGDDVEICHWWRQRGGQCGYVQGYQANHYETTDGQHARYPDYFARVQAEGKAA